MNRPLLIASVLFFLAALAGCRAAGSTGAPGAAVEGYLQSLAAQDVNAMIAHACAGWEAQAREEYNAFAAVKLNLDGVSCAQSGSDDSAALVTCSGKIIANYGNEDLEIDVADRTYRVVQEGGEWRMCGYSRP